MWCHTLVGSITHPRQQESLKITQWRRAGKVTQWVKEWVQAANPEGLSSIPRTHLVESTYESSPLTATCTQVNLIKIKKPTVWQRDL